MKPSTNTGGIAASISAVLTAVASSACCWLPLTLIAFGVSAGGIGTWFERYRMPFLAMTFILLAISFYLVYRRAPACETDEACACHTKPSRFIKGSLWVSTIIAIAFAAFPRYITAFITEDQPLSATRVAAMGATTQTVSIEGMSCKACAVTLQNDLNSVPGVVNANVSYESKSATLTLDQAEPASAADIRNTIIKAGYGVKPD